MPPVVIAKVAAVGALVLASKFLSKPPKIKPFIIGDAPLSPRENKFTIRSSITPHRVIYGETVVAGALRGAFWTGPNKEYLHIIIVLAGHECEDITDIWLGDDLSTALKFSGLVNIYKHLGSPTQTYDTNLAADVSQWTSAHRLQGLCYLYIKIKWQANVWLSGIPNVKAKVKGKKVYDPRTGTTAYSNNAALCQLDYLLSSEGVRMNFAKIDNDSWVAAANICDEDVPLSVGGTQKRYTCNGSFLRDQRPIDIMNHLLTASHGHAINIGGKWRGYAGAWVTPTVELTEDDLRGDMSFNSKPGGGRGIYNAVKGTFIDASEFNQATDFNPRTNSQYETDDGGTREYLDVELPFTTNHIMAQRIAQIHLELSRSGVLTFPANLKAFNLSPQETVYVSNTLLGWSKKTFRVVDWELADDWGINLILREDSSSVWAWSASQEQSLTVPPSPTLPDPYTVATPTGLTLTSAGEALQNTDGALLYRLKVAWTLLADEFVSSGGHYEVQYKKSTDATYATYALVAGDISSLYINGVKNAVSYDVQVRAINRMGVKSAFATVTGHTIATITTAPATPTGLTATGYATSIGLKWSANSESDIDGYVIERADNVAFTAGLVTISRPLSLSYIDELGTLNTTKYYRIYARNRSGNLSSATVGVSATTDGVTTARINNNAVTANGYFSNDAQVIFDNTEQELGTITVTPDGGYFLVLGSCVFSDWGNGNTTYELRIRKDSMTGTVIAFSTVLVSSGWNGASSIMAIDSTPSSPQTYKLTGWAINGWISNDRYEIRKLVGINLKK